MNKMTYQEFEAWVEKNWDSFDGLDRIDCMWEIYDRFVNEEESEDNG